MAFKPEHSPEKEGIPYVHGCNEELGGILETINQFPAEVAEKLKTYVYRLIDPRNGETFYVGKGKGGRVFSHIHGDLNRRLEGRCLLIS